MRCAKIESAEGTDRVGNRGVMYELSAVIADFDLLCGCLAGSDSVPVAALRQGLGLVPARDVPVGDASTSGANEPTTGPTTGPGRVPSSAPGMPGVSGVPEPDEPLAAVSPAFEAVAAAWSRHGTVAYVAADFAGGTGWQAAVVWRAGARLWGPAYDTEFRGPRPSWPVNHALSLLGAVPHDPSSPDPDAGGGGGGGGGGAEQPAYADVFHRVGLGWESDTDAWRAVGRADRERGYAAALERREDAFRTHAAEERRRQLDLLPAVLDGRTIMQVLGVGPGPLVGAAARHLKELTQVRGALTQVEAMEALHTWARGQALEHEHEEGPMDEDEDEDEDDAIA
ncbi:MAG: hypothetical protein HOU01_12600 [Streptomycetaceae bacterium]|nr:hypothetical protein [Streptomycetaceae bacterium]